MSTSILLRYQTLNNTFKKKLVFHLGVDAGFFSEFNNMILAMLYCLENKISFRLYSATANFGIDKGWTDYFDPFCEEDTNKNHKRFNFRMPISERKPYNKIDDSFLNKTFNSLKQSFDPLSDKVIRLLYFRESKPFDYFTYNLWNKIRSIEKDHFFDLSVLDIKGDTQEAASKLIKMIWRFNLKTLQRITNLISSIGLPQEYIGFHIRNGDKGSEFTLLKPLTYFKKAESITDIRVAFILTDDYRTMNELHEELPNWKFFTLCEKDERGYSNRVFNEKSKEYKDKNLIKLFASIEVLNNSYFFIGTFSSNPGMFLGMRRPKNKCIGMDYDSWVIW